MTEALLRCRLCDAELQRTFVDLGMSPLCESFLTRDELDGVERFYPLNVRVCEQCLLVQLPDYVPPTDIFREYAYFSAFSDSWVEHARMYSEAMIERFGLNAGNLVVELASNDGYLLQHFVARQIPVLGIDPAANVAKAAKARGVETLVDFFDWHLARELAAQGRTADLVVANNVLAQVPALNDFVAGIELLLSPGGVATIEVPHLARLIGGLQFDTIYHEHYSYFSLTTLGTLCSRHGLEIFDVEELSSHGGSLRVYVRRPGERSDAVGEAVARILGEEQRAGYDSVDGYVHFADRVAEVKWELLELLIGRRRAGKSVVGYGAPGKGNTLLNYCGIRSDLLDYTVDRNPYKHGRFLPGTHIPIYAPDHLAKSRPDYILVLPWNLRKEISAQLTYTREWGAQLIVPIPRPEVLEWLAVEKATAG